MSWLGDALARRLASGFAGQVARLAVRRHPFVWGDPSRVRVAAGVKLHDTLLNCASGTITIAPDVFVGHGVSLLTGTHDHHQLGAARGSAVPRSGHDITIGEGVWLASNVTVLGPCTIGEHAVVATGAVVTTDVAPYTVVGGVPARVISRVPEA